MEYGDILRPSLKNNVSYAPLQTISAGVVGRKECFFHVSETTGSVLNAVANSADLDQNIPEEQSDRN